MSHQFLSNILSESLTNTLELFTPNAIKSLSEETASHEYRRLKDLLKQVEEEHDIFLLPYKTFKASIDEVYKPTENKLEEVIGSIKSHMLYLKEVRESQPLDLTAEAVHTATKYKSVTKLVITDRDMIPREFMVPDEKAIKAALMCGVEVPGAELVTQSTVSL